MDDGVIVELFWKRDESAIERITEKYGDACRAAAYGILHNDEDAEECVNDAYLRVWEAIPPEQPERLGAFVCRIVRNLAIDRLKSYSAAKRAHKSEIYDEMEACIPTDMANEVVDRLTLTAAINRFLYTERPESRMVFMRRYFYMDSCAEIAKLMHMTEGHVRMITHRTRKRLRAFLEKEGFEI